MGAGTGGEGGPGALGGGGAGAGWERGPAPQPARGERWLGAEGFTTTPIVYSPTFFPPRSIDSRAARATARAARASTGVARLAGLPSRTHSTK